MITLKGDPKSTQHIYRAACRGRFPTMYMTAEGKAIKDVYKWEAKSQWRGAPLKGDVLVKMVFYFKTKRRRDLDNMNKLIFDALSGIVYDDDSQICELIQKKAYDPANPRIVIEASAIN